MISVPGMTLATFGEVTFSIPSSGHGVVLIQRALNKSICDGATLNFLGLKGTVQRDFRPQVLFIIRTYLDNSLTGEVIFDFC